jgi:hypothetical protein
MSHFLVHVELLGFGMKYASEDLKRELNISSDKVSLRS